MLLQRGLLQTQRMLSACQRRPRVSPAARVLVGAMPGTAGAVTMLTQPCGTGCVSQIAG